MMWVLVALAIALVVICACRVSGQQDAAAAELERALRDVKDDLASQAWPAGATVLSQVAAGACATWLDRRGCDCWPWAWAGECAGAARR